MGARLQGTILRNWNELTREDCVPERDLQQNPTSPNSQNDIPAGAAPQGGIISTLATNGGAPSLVEMAQRDLDAALQLLADRAQYITGASGAAIALRRDGRNDMLCRASAGSNAPQLGALLSAEFGLSGESVRTRRLLRCDDAERDSRVNREVCRQLGIASVVVMPVVNDDEVLGVFELFSGKAHAFGERDLSAVQRLSGMVETAVRLAKVTQELPEKLKAEPFAAAEGATPDVEQDSLDEDILEVDVVGPTPVAKAAVEAKVELPQAPKIVEPPKTVEKVAAAVPAAVQAATRPAVVTETFPAKAAQKDLPPQKIQAEKIQAEVASSTVEAATAPTTVVQPPEPETAPHTREAASHVAAAHKPMFWSAAAVAGESAGAKTLEDESNVPPMLRGLKKCEACGFPISGGRVLCVECEEKKWRGQLRKPQGTPMPTGALPQNPERKPEAQALAAVATGSATKSALPATGVASIKTVDVPLRVPQESSKGAAPTPALTVKTAVRELEPRIEARSESSTPLFSAGLGSSQSWWSRNKYVLGVLVLVAAVIAGVLLLR